jgi:hypothetical protein
MRIIDIRHSDYNTASYEKWRLTFEGGDKFKTKYLQMFSTRESQGEFNTRSQMAYVPAFAKSAIVEIRNSIFDRLTDVTRVGGSTFYQEAVNGYGGGVDMLGSKMSDFVGKRILDDLLVIGKVGVYIDRPADPGVTLLDTKKPYLYIYKAEDILSWSTDFQGRYTALLLRATVDEVDDESGLVEGETEVYRHFRLVPDGVQLDEYDSDGKKSETTTLDLPEIPFVLFQLSDSLMRDVADYQIALMNIASSDLNYAILANFPFYTEQYSPQADYATRQTTTGTAAEAATAGPPKIEAGIMKGRRYPQNLERPGFIAPPSEPLQVSMEKQEAMKAEIRQLLQLALTNIRPQRQSAGSKEKDSEGLEAGLSAIGMELAHGEREIARFWGLYEGTEQATVEYPSQYSLRSEEERQAEATEKADLLPKIPSLTYQRQIAKRIVALTLGSRASNETLQAIDSEIDKAKVISIDPEVLAADHEAGFVGTETASKARLYPAGEVDKAKKDHAERAARVALAQSKANQSGVSDLSTDPKREAKEQKEDSQSADDNVDPKKKVRP